MSQKKFFETSKSGAASSVYASRGSQNVFEYNFKDIVRSTKHNVAHHGTGTFEQ